MSSKPRRHFGRHMIRPTVYKTFSRVVIALTAALLWNEFVNLSGLIRTSYAFLFVAVLFFVFAWMAYLRMDGVKLPNIDRRLFDWKRKPPVMYGDMIDHVDEEPPAFDDLDDDEKELCVLMANGICCVLFGLLSFI